jgi:hypothetical protein
MRIFCGSKDHLGGVRFEEDSSPREENGGSTRMKFLDSFPGRPLGPNSPGRYLSTYPYNMELDNMTKERIELSLDSEVIKQLRIDAIQKYNNLRSVSRLIEDMVRANIHKPDIQAIKADREKYKTEWMEAELELLRDKSGGMLCSPAPPQVKCNTCDSEFDPFPFEGNFCPTCSGQDLRLMDINEDNIFLQLRREARKIWDAEKAAIKAEKKAKKKSRP